MTSLFSAGISILDLISLLWFIMLWSGYVYYTKRRCRQNDEGLLAAMNRVRRKWATEILHRDNRIMDSQIINALIRKETFFASTTMLILASSVALIGVSDHVLAIFQNIPFAEKSTQVLWVLKVVTLTIIFMVAFFKFTWSIRQSSYCATLLGSLPSFEHSETAEAKRMASRLADLSNLAGNHFNDGLRAYYFALAELSWFLHPVAFIISTSWVVVVLYRREYHSKALNILS